MGFRNKRDQSKRTFRLFMAAQENIQELDEGDPGFQFLVFL
jgi:hypothetical protein